MLIAHNAYKGNTFDLKSFYIPNFIDLLLENLLKNVLNSFGG